jgi:hypothetical protein
MASAPSMVAHREPFSATSEAGMASPAILRTAGLAPDLPALEVVPTDVIEPDLAAPEVVGPDVIGPDLAAPEMVPPDVIPPDVIPPDVIPTGVMDQLTLLLGAAGEGGLSGASSERALAVVEAVEAVKAWADSVSLEATAVMVAEFERDFVHLAPQGPSSFGRRRFVRHCRSAAAREIQVATGLPITACQRRVWFAACESERVGGVREAMRAGRVGFARALALTEATAHLDGFTAAAIAARVLRPLTGRDGQPLAGSAPLSQATFRARLQTQLVLHHGLVGEAERSYEEALKGRRLSAEPNKDGTGTLLVTGDGPRLAAAQSRVDKIARRLRNGGDGRTLAQLRADVATDLLLRGWIPNDPTFIAAGKPPVAMVQLIVSLATVMGLDGGVGQIPGWGAVHWEQARALALRAGSIWKRVVSDPLTGRAIEVSAGTYQVPAGMAEQVKARDGTCRAPGCEIPAERCDLDHCVEWERDGVGGATAEPNLTVLHRGHHNLKTLGFWDSNQFPDGTLRWTTATGRNVTTYPYVYDNPDHQPIKTSTLEALLGRQLAPDLNPDIPMPAHFSIFDEIGWGQTLAPATPQPPKHEWPRERAGQQSATPSSSLDAPPF